MIRIFATLAVVNAIMLVASFGVGIASKLQDGVRQPDGSLYLMHFVLGLAAANLTLLVHCIIFTYFLGTGRWVKEVKLAYHMPDEPWPKLTRELKRKTFPPALAAMLITIATAAAGAGAQLQAWHWMVHATLATITLLVNLWAFVIEFRNVRTNALVIEKVLSAVDQIRAERGLPSNAVALETMVEQGARAPFIDKEVEMTGSSKARELATLGGGCFWCLEAVFELLTGVEKVESGYAGGKTSTPTYPQVCEGNTGHAEVVQITFDPTVVAYREILDVFFTIHDPTTLNRQGADVGSQYRSAIFAHTPEHQQIAKQRIAELNAEKIWDSLIVTEVVPLDIFHRAEDYHQGYFRGNTNQQYCQAVVAPKVAKFRKRFASKLKR